MKILIVGLGLSGASLAKTLQKNTTHYVMGWNRTASVMKKAYADGAIDTYGPLEELIPEADITIVNIYPDGIVPFILEHKHLFKKGSIVTDSCGIKTKICRALEKEKLDFTFIGGHPMAGREVSGYDASLDNLFEKASYIFTPLCAPQAQVQRLCDLADEMHFARCVVTTPEHHDAMIAYTSQIAHVLACSYILSPRAPEHDGYSAGSYRDVSRVAKINADMWTELFLDNSANLTAQIDELIRNLTAFKDAIAAGDSEKLHALLSKGNAIKEEIG